MGEQNLQQPDEGAKKDSAYLIKHDKPNCIGCAACESVAPDFWVMNAEGDKADIVGGTNKDDDSQELDIEEKDFTTNKEAADSCPVNVIHIINKKTGEKII